MHTLKFQIIHQDWLAETLKPVLASDPFTAKLVELMLAAPKQSVRLGLHRSDYMVDGPSGSILQVSCYLLTTVAIESVILLHCGTLLIITSFLHS